MRAKRRFSRCVFWAALVSLSAACQAGSYQLRTGVKNPSGGTISYTGTTLGYTSNANGYGASGSDSAFVTCSGTITTIYDWVPNQIPNPDKSSSQTTIADPLDTPPAQVISQETCTATYYGEIDLLGDGGGSCDNGLGFDPIEYDDPVYTPSDPNGNGGGVLVGYDFGGTSAGTLYTVRPGGQTVTLTCTQGQTWRSTTGCARHR